MHVSGQTIQTVIALGIVAVAAAAVGRRLWAQAAAFRAPRRRAVPPRPPTRPAPPAASPLIQIQRRPPVHLKRPPPMAPKTHHLASQGPPETGGSRRAPPVTEAVFPDTPVSGGPHAGRNDRSRVVGSLGLLLTLAGCAPHAQPPPTAQASPDLHIALTVRPPNPRQLDPTAFTVTLRDGRGRPVSHAAVTVDLTMPAMDMGRDAVAVEAQGPGAYGGTGRFTMAGDWRVTVTAARGPAKSVQSVPVSVQ